MAWLSSFGSWLGGLLLEFVWKKLVNFVSALWAKFQKDKEIKKEARESVEPLKKAESAQEIDKASDSALDGF